MTTAREEFSSQVDPQLLAKLRQVAEIEGKQFQTILEEALTEYLERHQEERHCSDVLEAFGMSMQEFDELYKNLAK